MNKRLIYFSPAKINLFLHIKKKRKDGYHEILSDFALVDFYDEIEFFLQKKTDKKNLYKNYTLPTEDLIEKTIEVFSKEIQREFPLSIKIKKKIPIGSGLGGGSSNAATVLLALNNIFSLGLRLEKIYSLANQIGADVPFFLYQKSLRMGGRGEKKIAEIKLPKLPILILKPHFSCSSAKIYQLYSANKTEKKQVEFSQFYDFQAIKNISSLQNDLYQAACQEYPKLEIYKKKLLETNPLAVQMSGSGSSLFAIYQKKEERDLASEKLKACQKEYNLYHCFLL